jgi:hypothetical protein
MSDTWNHYQPQAIPSTTIGELDQLSERMDKDLQLVDRSFFMNELASVSRVRDYINHIESQVCRETVMVDDMLMKEHLNKMKQIEASVRRDSWIVITTVDTNVLKQWVRDASAYQTEVNNEETTNSALAPKPIQSLTGELFFHTKFIHGA